MDNKKNTIYFIVIAAVAAVAFMGWFVFSRLQQTAPAYQVSEPAYNESGAVTILEPGAKGEKQQLHSEDGWQKISGIVPVKLQTTNQVEKAVFYLGGTVVGEKISPPFDFNLDTGKYSDCMYILRVKAFDALGNELGEDRSQIWIDNVPDKNCM